MSLSEFLRPLPSRRALCRALFLGLALAGCGGGVDSGGTGGSASFASGPITGFGSVIVNGVRFDDSSARVTDGDGAARSRDDLRLGMTAEVHAGAIADDGNGPAGAATSVTFHSELLGPLTNIDLTAKTLVVLGQTVEVKPTTVFDDSLTGGLNALGVGDVVEVYALFDAAGNRYAATRIERKTAAAVFRLRGVVSALDTNAKTFLLGGQRVSYANLAANEVPAALANGNILRVRVQPTQVNGAWVAARLSDGVVRIEDLGDARVKGRITSFISATAFSVNGVAVDAAAASFPDGAVSIGMRVEVEGTSRAGVLVARKVEIETDSQAQTEGFQLRGAITSVDSGSQTFVLRGVVVSYAGSVEFKDGGAGDLAAGKDVDVRGTLSADGTRLQATRITFRK